MITWRWGILPLDQACRDDGCSRLAGSLCFVMQIMWALCTQAVPACMLSLGVSSYGRSAVYDLNTIGRRSGCRLHSRERDRLL